MIREESIYVLKKLSPDAREGYGTRVLVMRRFPRGIRRQDIDLWMPSAGPSTELLAALRTGQVTWDQFIARYIEEQEQQASCRVVSYEQSTPKSDEYACRSLDYLARLACGRKIITLLCWEQHPHCHRFALQARLSNLIAQESEGRVQCP